MLSKSSIYNIVTPVSIVLALLIPSFVVAQPPSDSIAVKILIDSAAKVKSLQARVAIAKEAHQKALTSKSSHLLADALYAVGNALFRSSDYDAAIDSLQKGLIIYNQTGDSVGIARTYYMLGSCYIRKSNYAKAIHFIEESVRLSSMLHDSSLLANNFNSLGIIYYTFENYAVSMDFFEKAASFYEKNKSYKNLVRAKGNIGLCLIKTGNEERARRILFGTLKDMGKYMDSLMLASFFDNIGLLYESIGKIDSALYYHSHSFAISKALNSSRGVALSNLAIGRCHKSLGEWANAKTHLLEALHVLLKNGDEDIAAQANQQLASCYEALGDYKKSYKHLKDFIDYTDKTFTRQLINQIDQLHAMLQLLKEEKENQQLQLKAENEQKDKKIITVYTLFSILLLLAFGVIAYFYHQLSMKKKFLEQANTQLFRFNNELDLLVKHRTLELNNAVDKIRELERIKSAFLANISHEIRTPLNGILGFSYYLTTPECTPEERIQLGEQVKRLGNKLVRIVDDILELSKIETNQVNLLLSEVNLNHLLDDVYKDFSTNNDLVGKNLFFRLNKSQTDSKSVIVCDYNRLRSILVHLLENAFKFTHQGGVEMGYTITENSTLYLYVKDTGVGIPSDIQKRVFERFYKHFDNSNPIFYDGLGIGLTIAMGYAIALGGSIKLESSHGSGSTFTLVLPVTFPNPQNKKMVVDFTGERVLIVEDDLISYQYLQALLGKTGATVIHVKNAEDAIEVATIDKSISLILLDLQLPFKSGIDAAVEIRKVNRDVPIIAQTATDIGDKVKICRDVGCNAFIMKPIDPDELLVLMRRLIK